MKKFILLGIFLLNFVFMQNSVFSQEQNIYSIAYINRLQNRVKSNWEMPHGQADKKTVVFIEVDKNGNLVKSNLVNSSEDIQFDGLAILAISKSAPFEPFSQNASENSIRLKFTFNQNNFEAIQISEDSIPEALVQKKLDNDINLNIQNSALKNAPASPDDSGEANIKDINFQPYIKNLQKQIKCNWSPPKHNESKRVVTIFKIGKDGTLLESKILKTSSCSKCDQSALDAIKNTAPFSPLPSGYSGESVDIQFTFDYNVWGQNSCLTTEDINNNYVKCDYKKMVEAIISNSLPKGLYVRDKCLVMRLEIRKDGSLQSVRVIHSSRDKNFDSKYVTAVRKCSLPSFPDSLDANNFSLDYMVQVNKSQSALKSPYRDSFWMIWSALLLSSAIHH